MDSHPQGAAVPDWTPPEAPEWDRMEGHYVRLERLAPDHVSDLFRANAEDARIWDYLPYGPFASEADYARWVADVSCRPDPMFFALRPHDTGRAAGVASYLRINPAAGSIELGHINLSASLQRSRAATEAFCLMIGWAFRAGYRRFEWKCNALNLGSRRAAERLGLSYEGTFRQAMVVKGRNRDTAWFAAIDGEWPRLEEAYGTWLAPENFDDEGSQRRALSSLTAPILAAKDPSHPREGVG